MESAVRNWNSWSEIIMEASSMATFKVELEVVLEMNAGQ